jgi:hypothetical protein
MSFNRQSCIKSAAYYFKDAASDKKEIGVVVPFVGPGLQSDSDAYQARLRLAACKLIIRVNYNPH